jgi:hypothetical protein
MKALLWPTLFSCAFVAVIYYLCNLFTELNWYLLGLKIMCIIVVYAGFFFTAGISKAERSKLKEALFSRFMPAGNP